jgi:hypothetical protein
MATRYTPLLLHQATGAVLTIPTDWISLRYARNVCGMGWFELVLPGDFSVGQEKRFTDWRLVVWRTPSGGREYLDFAGFVRRVERTYSGGVSRITLSGPDYNEVLARRIIAYAAGTAYARKAATAADDLMKDFVAENLGASCVDTARDISAQGFSVQADLTAGTSLTKSAAWNRLDETLRQLYESSRKTAATATFYGVVPLGDGYDMEFRTRAGQWGQDHRYPDGPDGAVIFSIERGNLDNVRQVYDASSEVNYVYGCGEGQLENRIQVTAGDATRIAASVLNRREAAYENPGIAVSASLTDEAQEELEAGEPVQTFTADPLTVEGCAYGVHWGLGDQVTAIWLEDRFDCHIAGVEVSVDESGETIAARMATWP